MEAKERGGFQDDGDTDQPARPHEQRTEAGDHAIPEPEGWRTLPGAIEDQQLLLDEQRFGHDGTHPAWTGERATVASCACQIVRSGCCS